MKGREAWPQEASVDTREEDGCSQACRGETVAVGSRDTLDQLVKSKTSQVVGHAPLGEFGWGKAQQVSQGLA